MENNTLIDRIRDLINTDDDDTQLQSSNIIDYYNESTEKQKKVIDDIFIALCGYSLNTLIKQL